MRSAQATARPFRPAGQQSGRVGPPPL